MKKKIPECFPKTKRKIIERGKIDTSNTQIHDRSFSVFGLGTSMKSGRVKIVVWVQVSPASDMIRSCRCIPHVSKMLVLTYNWGNSAIIESPAIQLKAVTKN
jgi:hypothetical protein